MDTKSYTDEKYMSKMMSLAKKFFPPFAGALQFYFGEPNPGWASVHDAVKAKDYSRAWQSALAGMTGIRLKGAGQATTEFDVIGTLNPIDLRNAPAPKLAMLARLSLEGIDTVGKFISNLFKDILK